MSTAGGGNSTSARRPCRVPDSTPCRPPRPSPGRRLLPRAYGRSPRWADAARAGTVQRHGHGERRRGRGTVSARTTRTSSARRPPPAPPSSASSSPAGRSANSPPACAASTNAVIRIGREALRCLLPRRGITFQHTKARKESPGPECDTGHDRIEMSWSTSWTGSSPSASSGSSGSAPPRAPARPDRAGPTGCRRPTAAPTASEWQPWYPARTRVWHRYPHRRDANARHPDRLAAPRKNAPASAARRAVAGADAHSRPQPDQAPQRRTSDSRATGDAVPHVRTQRPFRHGGVVEVVGRVPRHTDPAHHRL